MSVSTSSSTSLLRWRTHGFERSVPYSARRPALGAPALRSVYRSPFQCLLLRRLPVQRTGSGGVLCKGTKWADRLSRDLYAVGPNESTGDEVERGPLSRHKVEEKNGGRGSTINSALASSFPSITSKTEKTVALPLDYYQVLGADTHFLADAVIRAYEARVRNPPGEGFSEDALVARQEILRGACETLANPDMRGEYNDGLVEDEAGTIMVDVPFSKVPGAMCLLQEVGEMEVVLQVGQNLLRERLPKFFQRDVVLAMALAYVELSREAMAESPPAIARSCELLERALKLLQECGSSLAPTLQEQIDDTLQQINPRCMLELLALPLDKEHEGKREEGLQGIRSILWAVGEGGASAPVSGFTREEFMNQAFICMTASEQVALFTATPSNIPAESSEVYAVALAHVAEGFVGKKPRLIQEADTLFLQLQQTNAPSSSFPADFRPADQRLDFALERAMCAILLGELDDCRAWLGLDDKNSPYRDPSIMDFVIAHSFGSEEGDYLAGLCKLLESWLREVVFPSFRETNELQVKLRDFYDDPGVLSYLEKLEKGESPLAAAAAIVQLGAGAGAALDSVKESALKTLQKVFAVGKARASLKLNDSMPAETVAPQLKNLYDQQHRKDSYHGPQQQNFDGSSITAASSSPDGIKLSEENWDDSEMLAARESDKRQAFAPIQIACAGVLIGALAFGSWRILSGQHGFMKYRRETSTGIMTADSPGSASDIGQDAIPRMDAQLAENLVQNWQSAKAQALGADHAVGKLSEVLDGQMLKGWSERARDVSKNGWYWEYKLISLSIDSVTISTDGRRAIVEATLQEAASLYDQKKVEVSDSYHSTYTTRYELKVINGIWKITSGAVLRS